MPDLKLIKGRSYTGYGVHATIKNPVVSVDKKEIADSLIANGYFKLISEVPAATDVAVTTTEKPVEKMTDKELDAYAAENGINLSGITGKAKKLTKIQEALAALDAADELFPEE